MNRYLFTAILTIATCGGCENNAIESKTSLQATEEASAPPISVEGNSHSATDRTSSDNVGTNLTDQRQQYVSFPAAGVKLVRPKGFDDAENFHGFQQPNTKSSVMAVMIPGPYSETSRGFTAEQLKTHGMKLRSKEDVRVDGNTAVLLSVTQNAYGTEFEKWILAVGNEKETRMVTATFPKSEEKKLSNQLKAVVLSTTIDDTPPPDPTTDVGFVIAAPTKLKLTKGISKMLMYTKDGTIPLKSAEDPFFIAGSSISQGPIDDRRQFATQRLLNTANTRIIAVISNSEITIDGLDGYEIVADGNLTKSGNTVKVYQVLLYDDGTYILMQGRVAAHLADEYMSEFKTMARSLTRKPK